MSIQERKKDHVDLTVNQDVLYKKSAGFDRYDFIHNALPEVNPAEIDLSAELLGRTFSFPLFISSMTGGYTDAGSVNAIIAAVCEELNLPFGVGSQRAMLEDPEQIESFSVVRNHAPNAFIAANIGGAQLIGGLSREKLDLLIDSISADAVIVHLNPLQELMQPEGDHDFVGIEEGIKDLVKKCELPVIVKETGAGISTDVAKRLLQSGISVIDVAGAGGTSWAKVENLRDRQQNPMHQFDDWGMPTVDCIEECARLKSDFSFDLIASGGIRSAFDMVKSLALGADFTATAQPIIKAIDSGGKEALIGLINQWKQDTRIILALLGYSSIRKVERKCLKKL